MNHSAPITDEASHILSGWQKDTLGERMAAHARQMAPARHPMNLNPDKPVFILDYVHGALITSGGPYANATIAKSACGEVGKWIELPDGGWRSEDGRSLIVSEVRR